MADCAVLLQRINPLAQKFAINIQKAADFKIGFNLFELISDHHKRETFNSDILNALLDPEGEHGEKDKFLQLFLNYLRFQYGATIDPTHYADAQVVKEGGWEEGRIDILIKGRKHAIIIENKINGAGDAKKQLPRYLKKVIDVDGYACDAIIYLRLNRNSGPDMTDWTDDEKKEVIDRLIKIPAYDETEKDLLNGWILKCQNESIENPDAHHVLRQYGRIIKKNGGNGMNKPIMKEFYNVMIEGKGENLKTALVLKEMVDNLISYRLEQIIEKFDDKRTPFENLGPSEKTGACFRGCKDIDLGLDIWVAPDSYLITFRDRDDPSGANSNAKILLEKMGKVGKDYEPSPAPEEGVFRKKFKFPSGQNEDLLQHMTAFKEELARQLELFQPIR